MSNRTDRLLCCAVSFSQADVKETPIPKINKNSNVSDVIQSMMDVLWFEAKECMNNTMSEIPSDPYLHAVDIKTDEPGIVSSKNKIDIHRRTLPVPSVTYTSRPSFKLYDVMGDIPPDIPFEKAIAKANKEREKSISKSQRVACKDLNNEEKSLEKIKKREEAKERRQNETPEEREERLKDMREKRERKKQERALKSQEDAKEKDTQQTEDDVVSVEKKLDVLNDEDVSNLAIGIQELLESEAAADTNLHSILPTRIKAKNRKTQFHASPVPFDRHLIALERSDPSDEIVKVLLKYEKSDHVQIIQGPPGTGKSTRLVDLITECTAERIFVCAPTNIGAANIYSKMIKAGMNASLLMPQSRIPPGTPITSQDPNARIVCSTISGRSGPILDSQEFNAIFVDEAAQCMEAWFWGLLRKEVTDVIMVGDTAQLPALVSDKGKNLGFDKSLMQRLIENNYEFTFLDTQKRMHPEIVAYPNSKFYNGKLKTDYNDITTFDSVERYALYNVKGDTRAIGTSYMNDIEARKSIEIANELKKLSDNIVIICPYQAQARQILSYSPDIEVHTVDSFQGREADIVVLSMVRNKESGFWEDPRRLCVALTRAKHVLHIVCSCDDWQDSLLQLKTNAMTRNKLHVVI